jgi:hypothetical protein
MLGFVDRLWLLLLAVVLVCAQGGQPGIRGVRRDLGDHFEWSAGAAKAAKRFQSPIPFLAVGARWLGEDATIRVRASRDGIQWSAWRELSVSADGPATESGETSSNLLFFEWDSRYFEYTSDRPARFLFIDPGRTPEENLRAIARERDRRAITGRPFVVSRTDWVCPDGESARQPVSYTTVTHLIVHHTADSFSGTDYAAWVRAIWRFHVFNNGWIDVGYNYLIAPDGTIFAGRAGGDNVLGAHFSCQNGGTMGVALLGTYTSQPPSPEALDSLKRLLAWRAEQLKLDPTATTFHAGMNQDLAVISGHRDGNNSPRSCTRTECPGNAFYPRLRSVAAEVKAWIAGNAGVILRQDAESPAEGWEATGLWHISGRNPAVGRRSWWFGIADAGNYDVPGESPQGSLTSPEFDLRADAELSFHTWHDTEPDGVFFDRRLVEFRTAGGDWTLLERLDGPLREWSTRTLRLPARGRVQIRFRFDAGDPMFNRGEGWYLDEIQVSVPNGAASATPPPP